MARKERKLTAREAAHVLGRIAMALCIGWGYLVVIMALDIGGWGTWMSASAFGLMVKAQVVAIIGVAFGAVGAHIGLSNVMGETVRAHSAALAERRAAMRRWEKR